MEIRKTPKTWHCACTFRMKRPKHKSPGKPKKPPPTSFLLQGPAHVMTTMLPYMNCNLCPKNTQGKIHATYLCDQCYCCCYDGVFTMHGAGIGLYRLMHGAWWNCGMQRWTCWGGVGEGTRSRLIWSWCQGGGHRGSTGPGAPGGAPRGGEAVGLLDWFSRVMVIRPKPGLGGRKKSLD
jgi:hypothetical protein